MSELSTRELVGRKLTNIGGERLGRIDRLIYQGDRDEPDWAIVKRGLLGIHREIVPLAHVRDADGQAELIEEREWVRRAPEVELDGDRMSDEQADRLREHYGLERVATPTVEDDIEELPRETRDAKPPAMDQEPGSPISERRRRRARELGIPSAREMARER